jgi:hypothetical protein
VYAKLGSASWGDDTCESEAIAPNEMQLIYRTRKSGSSSEFVRSDDFFLAFRQSVDQIRSEFPELTATHCFQLSNIIPCLKCPLASGLDGTG